MFVFMNSNIVYKFIIKFEPDSEREPVDILDCIVSYIKHLQKLFFSLTSDKVMAILMAMHYFAYLKW